jgi:hypothetical protein
MSNDQRFWLHLLDAIEDGQVVPFIGRDLLVVQTATGPQPYHHLVAAELAQEFGLDARQLPERFDVNDVIVAEGQRNALRSERDTPPEIQRFVKNIIKRIQVAPPEPLRQLAAIDPLRLFVSTTFDDLLEQALAAARPKPPACVAFPSPEAQTDFDEDKMARAGSFVFYLLGHPRRARTFAVTESDVLEQMHRLISERQKWALLDARLAESDLLVLGVSFPDWLARFLIKLGRKNQLWQRRDRKEIIVDHEKLRDGFGTFIRLFSPESRLLTGTSPIEFVSELHSRWFERHPPEQAFRDRAPRDTEEPADMTQGSIFISYATEDQPAAFRLNQMLTEAGLETWIDHRLDPGDEFNLKIERHIRDCGAFIAVLSANTRSERSRRYFIREWKLACREEEFVPESSAFLFPVIIDETPVKTMYNLPSAIANRTAHYAPQGEPTERLIEQLRAAQRIHRKDPRRREQS